MPSNFASGKYSKSIVVLAFNGAYPFGSPLFDCSSTPSIESAIASCTHPVCGYILRSEPSLFAEKSCSAVIPLQVGFSELILNPSFCITACVK